MTDASDIHSLAAAPDAWWLCPNEPRCGHGAVLHDIEDFEGANPVCCVEGCTCGRRASEDR